MPIPEGEGSVSKWISLQTAGTRATCLGGEWCERLFPDRYTIW
jgi:hypothetical protein